MAMTAMTVGSFVAPILGGIIGGNAQKKAMAAAQQALAQAQQIINQVGAPPDLSAAIIMDQFKQVGLYTPEIEQAVNLGVSKVSQIKEDARTKDLQRQALEDISKIGRVGITPEERAQYRQLQLDTERAAQSRQMQLAQEMQMRGQGGGGAELAARLMAGQESAMQASEAADRIAAMASSRALQALTQSGQLASTVRGQEFDIERAKAQAEDEFSRFNVEQQIGLQQRNVAARNIAQQANLATQQRISEQNIAMANQERLRQAEAQRQYWQDKLSYAQARANPFGTQAQLAQQQGQQKAGMWQSIGSGIGAGLQNLALYSALKEQNQTTPTKQNKKSKF